MRKIILLLISVSFLIPTIAEGADWVSIGKTGDNTMEVFVDKESIKYVSKNIVRAWNKLVLLKPNEFHGKFVKKHFSFMEWDCNEIKKRSLQTSIYYSDGTSETESRSQTNWQYITPDTVEDSIFKYLCKNGK
jgi:hypothetical protein